MAIIFGTTIIFRSYFYFYVINHACYRIVKVLIYDFYRLYICNYIRITLNVFLSVTIVIKVINISTGLVGEIPTTKQP